MSPRIKSSVLTTTLGIVVMGLYAWQTERHYFLGDDSYISFRYALHLTEGKGLVWNVGEWVEGYTNFLWVLLMALGMMVQVPPQYLSNILGIASALAILLLVIRLTAKERGWSNPYIFATPLLLASSRTFTAWSTGGLATQFFALLCLAALLRFVHERESSHPPWGSMSLVILATLTRPEGGILTAVLGCFFLWDVLQKRRKAGHFLVWCAVWFAIIGAHFGWRHWAYGQWLPNTFYAKVNGAWLEQSSNYFWLFHKDYEAGWYAWLILVPALLRRRYIDYVLLAFVCVHISYLAYIGGDRFEFRFMAFILAPAYWLVTEALALLAERTRKIQRPEFIALLITSVLAGVTLDGSLHSENKDRLSIASIHHMRAYANRRAKDGAFLRSLVTRELLPQDLRICVGGAGALPYTSRLHTLDYFGLNDASIAQKEIKKRRRIGHEHRASPAYMREQGVIVYDILGNLVYDKSHKPSALLKKAKTRAKSMNAEILKARCRKVDDKYLIYATAVPTAVHDKAMKNLAKCDLAKTKK